MSDDTVIHDRYTWEDERLFRNGEYVAALEACNADEDNDGAFGRWVAGVLTDYPRQEADYVQECKRLRGIIHRAGLHIESLHGGDSNDAECKVLLECKAVGAGR